MQGLQFEDPGVQALGETANAMTLLSIGGKGFGGCR